MEKIIIAAAVLGLICGSAFAQTSGPAPQSWQHAEAWHAQHGEGFDDQGHHRHEQGRHGQGQNGETRRVRPQAAPAPVATRAARRWRQAA